MKDLILDKLKGRILYLTHNFETFNFPAKLIQAAFAQDFAAPSAHDHVRMASGVIARQLISFINVEIEMIHLFLN